MEIRCSDISLVFMGTPDFAVPALRRLHEDGFAIRAVVTQPDKPQGRHMELVPPPVKAAASELSIPVLQPVSMKEAGFADKLRSLKPDLIVTAAYGKILPPEILAIPRCCINIHASLLPKYRGAAPIQWSIFNGDRITGVTIMLMNEGMDTGDLIRSGTVEILPDMDAGELTDRLSRLGADLITGTILDFLEGRVPAVPQDDSQATTVKPIRKEDGRIDWSMPSDAVHNRIRGCFPWPGAYSTLNGKRVKIIRSRVLKDLPDVSHDCHKKCVPGTIIRSEDKTKLFVACGEGFLEVLNLQMEGCRCIPVSQCAHNIEPSSVLC